MLRAADPVPAATAASTMKFRISPGGGNGGYELSHDHLGCSRLCCRGARIVGILSTADDPAACGRSRQQRGIHCLRTCPWPYARVAAACRAAAGERQPFDGSHAVQTLTRRQPDFEAVTRDAALVSTRRNGWRDNGGPIAPDRFIPSAWTQFAVSELRRCSWYGSTAALDPACRSLGCRLERVRSRWPTWGALLRQAVDERDASKMIKKAPEDWEHCRNLANPHLHVLRHHFGQHHL
jgi:hypothetical protein